MPETGRQSSGGKSFFSRSKRDKGDKRPGSDEALPQDYQSGSTNSKTRHERGSSVASFDQNGAIDPSGLALTSGVITSIPYDNAPDGRTPIPMDYLPRSDQMPVRQPQPHHLNKSGVDFHQYPTFDPGTVARSNTNASQVPSGPRPPPRQSNVTMTSTGDRSTNLQQWGPSPNGQQPIEQRPGSSNRPESSTSRYESYHGREPSYIPRKSYDQASLRSADDRASVFSQSSARMPMPHSHSTASLAPSHVSSRESHRNIKMPHRRPDGFSAAPPVSNFLLEQPNDPEKINDMFLGLMQKRGWHNLPDQAKRQMMSYPTAKKWTLIYQDKLQEWQGEQKRRTTVRKLY